MKFVSVDFHYLRTEGTTPDLDIEVGFDPQTWVCIRTKYAVVQGFCPSEHVDQGKTPIGYLQVMAALLDACRQLWAESAMTDAQIAHLFRTASDDIGKYYAV